MSSFTPRSWKSQAEPRVRVLQALMRHYEHLKTTRAQQSVYAQSSDAAVVTASIREVIAALDEQIAQVARKIRQHFDDHPDLKRRRDLLTSIPGIGETTAGSILSEIPHLDRFQSAKAVAAKIRSRCAKRVDLCGGFPKVYNCTKHQQILGIGTITSLSVRLLTQ